LASAGILLDENNELIADAPETESIETKKVDTGMATMNMDQLEENLNQAIENEDYELASKIRDEINKRSES
jgi:protein-arginine kinase activator protein McsA